MPRRPKQGIEFAGWSVDIFDGDTKIDKLLDAQGWIGFGIYFYLCQMAYKFDGYFYRWAYDDSASTARRMGGGVGSKTVEETVRYCLQIGLFDKWLFDRVGILTSKGIQRRFLAAIQGRRVKSVIADYWLLDDSESEGLDKCAKNDCLQTTNAHLQETNTDLQDTYSPKSRVEESRVKESKEDIGADEPPRQTRFIPPTVEEVRVYCIERKNRVDPEKFVAFYSAKGWMIGKNKMKDWKQAVITWEKGDSRGASTSASMGQGQDGRKDSGRWGAIKSRQLD